MGVFTDTFNRSNGALGASWAATMENAPTIYANTALCQVGGVWHGARLAQATDSATYAQCVFVNPVVGEYYGYIMGGPVLRQGADGQDWLGGLGEWRPDNVGVYIYQFVAGNAYLRASHNPGYGHDPNGEDVRLELSGTTATLKYDSAAVTLTATGVPSLLAANASRSGIVGATAADEPPTSVGLDNFECDGTAGGVPAPLPYLAQC